MAKAKASIRITEVPVGEIEALWNDPSRWTAFVDGFGAVERTDGGWPSVGARVLWTSRPGGRGRVNERVREYDAGRRQVVAVDDAEIEGIQTVTYEDAGPKGIKMVVELEFEQKDPGLLARLAEFLFVRSAMKASLQRTLDRFERELVADRELTAE